MYNCILYNTYPYLKIIIIIWTSIRFFQDIILIGYDSYQLKVVGTIVLIMCNTGVFVYYKSECQLNLKILTFLPTSYSLIIAGK